MSFLNNLIIKPIEVTVEKNIIPITIGDIILPNNIPKLNHSLFGIFKICGLNKDIENKIIEIINGHKCI
tara:strand:- start:62 stop:268 length:207 start_codon:yes stop_codon:yes gene_type:complete